MSNEKETKVSALDAKAKALANEEDEDTKIAKLLKNMPKWRFYSLAVLTVIWTGFQLYIKLVKPLDPVSYTHLRYVITKSGGFGHEKLLLDLADRIAAEQT